MPQRLEQQAEEIISHNVLTPPANAPIREIVRIMVDRSRKCVLAIHQGQLVALKTGADIVRPPAEKP